jgi:hypothetical protein
MLAAGALLAAGMPAVADAPRLRPYAMARDAISVRGTDSAVGGPLLRPGAHTYKDTLKPGEKKYYTVELDAKSSAYVSAVAVPAPGSTMGTQDGIDVSMQTASGISCGIPHRRTFLSMGGAYPTADYAERVVKPGTSCQTAGTYRFVVERGEASGGDAAAVPVELKYLAVRDGKQQTAEPDLAGPTPTATGDTGGTGGTGSAGGTGFDDAPVIRPGVLKDTVRPGETRFYRVSVDWGQQLFADAQFGSPGAPTAPYVIGGIRLGLSNSARGFVTNKVGNFRGEPQTVTLDTAKADAANAGAIGLADPAKAMRFAGAYYLQVSVSPKVGGGGGDAVPVTLRVDVNRDGKPPQPPTADTGTLAPHLNHPVAAGSSGGGGMRVVGYAGLGTGTALLAGLGGWTLAARRRKS